MLLAKDVGHFVAEVAAKMGWKEFEEPAEQAFGAHRVYARLKRTLRRAMASVCSSRAASARATSRPKGVSS